MEKKNNNKRNRIPRGYLAEDSDRRLEWLKDKHNFELHVGLYVVPYHTLW